MSSRPGHSGSNHVVLRGVAIAVVGLFAVSACSSSDDDATLATTQAQLEDANTKNSELQDNLDASEATNSSLAAENSTAQATNDQLTSSLADETKRADDAEAQVAAIDALFPVPVTSSLDGIDVIGSWNMTFTEAFCSGVPACGTPRPVVNANISQGPVGLVITVPTVFTTSLLDVNGNLMAATDSDQIIVCNGAPKSARVSVTLWGDAITVDQTGVKTLTGLGASVFVEAPDTSGCPAVSVIYGAKLVHA